jgi:Rieske Fe-S protein
LRRLGETLLGLFALPALWARPGAGAQVGPGVQVGTMEQLRTTGRILTSYRGLPVLVFEPTRGASGRDVRVLSALCTHEYCVVDWNPDAGRILCPCHGAQFDPAGQVLEGPPPSPLLSFPVRIEEGKIFVVEE